MCLKSFDEPNKEGKKSANEFFPSKNRNKKHLSQESLLKQSEILS